MSEFQTGFLNSTSLTRTVSLNFIEVQNNLTLATAALLVIRCLPQDCWEMEKRGLVRWRLLVALNNIYIVASEMRPEPHYAAHAENVAFSVFFSLSQRIDRTTPPLEFLMILEFYPNNMSLLLQI